MNPAKTRHLFNRFPKLYSDINVFECGDGWYHIINMLSERIYELDHKDHARVLQVKEKFGTLRFYLSHGTNKMYKYISVAESMSVMTCETCGWAGKARDNKWTNWIRTLCDECYAKIHS